MRKEPRFHYSSENLPPNLSAALDRIAILTEENIAIQGQLGATKVLLDDRNVPWQDPKKKQAMVWSGRAKHAKASKEGELAFLKNWARHERVRIEAELCSDEVDPNNTRSLLAGAWRLLKNLRKEGVDLTEKESALVKVIEKHLSFF